MKRLGEFLSLFSIAVAAIVFESFLRLAQPESILDKQKEQIGKKYSTNYTEDEILFF